MSTSLVGKVIGPADITQFIGEGAVGVVYRGMHRTLGIDVAVKVLKEHHHGDARRRERFANEARIAARLDHPGIVRVLDFGEHEGAPYLVMEYIDGHTLERYLSSRDGAVAETTGLRILLSVAAALTVAHQQGIVHRDLKPANLLLTRKGVLKIADLGLARQDEGPHLTAERMVVGTPAYLAPEALAPGGTIDARGDLYALGVIGYQLAFGRMPYSGTSTAMIRGHMAGSADWGLPTEWSKPALALVRRLMALRPEDRPESAAEVAGECRRLLGTGTVRRGTASGSGSGSGSGSRGRVSGSAEFAQLSKFLEDRLGAHETRVGGRTIVHTSGSERKAVWLILAAVVAVVVVGVVMFGGGRSAATVQHTAPAGDPATAAPTP
jgi:serine/threonine protein kinase